MAKTASSMSKPNFKEDCSLFLMWHLWFTIDNVVMIYLTETFRCSKKKFFFTQKFIRKIVFKLNQKARQQEFWEKKMLKSHRLGVRNKNLHSAIVRPLDNKGKMMKQHYTSYIIEIYPCLCIYLSYLYVYLNFM